MKYLATLDRPPISKLARVVRGGLKRGLLGLVGFLGGGGGGDLLSNLVALVVAASPSQQQKTQQHTGHTRGSIASDICMLLYGGWKGPTASQEHHG